MNTEVADIVCRILEEGDAVAYGELVERFADPAFCVAYSILGNREDARDIVQDAFVTAYEMLPALRDRAKFAAWLKRIVAGLSKNFLRDNKCHAAIHARLGHTLPSVPDPAALAASDEQEEAVYAHIMALPERGRAIIIMKYLEGMRYDEIASFLETSVRSVKALAHEAKRLLLARLARHKIHVPMLGWSA